MGSPCLGCSLTLISTGLGSFVAWAELLDWAGMIVSEMEYFNYFSKANIPGRRNGVCQLHYQDHAKDQSFGSTDKKQKQNDPTKLVI